MKLYLAAHHEFVAWLDGLAAAPEANEVEKRLRSLAMVSAERGMTATHWTFVVDGLVAYAERKFPGDILLSSYLARGFDYSNIWNDLRRAVRPSC
jgi:hypothetical protein